tara:strand:+ start:925 stop:1419 length:495 start_codon:yes stop_codon:yes gene_type:complete
VAYNADIATATSMAPQLGTLSSTTTPTVAQGNVIWAKAYNEVRVAFLSAGLADTFSSSSIAEAWAQNAEMFLTSGTILLAKGSIGADGKATADELIRSAKELLDQVWEKRDFLLAHGASASLTGPSIFAKSHWTQDSDPDFDYAPGTGDRPYACPPAFNDCEDL